MYGAESHGACQVLTGGQGEGSGAHGCMWCSLGGRGKGHMGACACARAVCACLRASTFHPFAGRGLFALGTLPMYQHKNDQQLQMRTALCLRVGGM